jgi:uncharacterized protein (DUF952 family)
MTRSDGSPVSIVYKIVPRADWQAACQAGCYQGSSADARDGFIHFSARYQLVGTAAKHFRGIDDLLLVAFEAKRLGPDLRWEPSRGGDLFPHLYGVLETSLAMWTRPLPLGADDVPMIDDAVWPTVESEAGTC